MLRDFADGTTPILITTDLAARGMDFANISCVVHLGLAFDTDAYVHRSGRTGRNNNTGTSHSILASKEVATYRTWMTDL